MAKLRLRLVEMELEFLRLLNQLTTARTVFDVNHRQRNKVGLYTADGRENRLCVYIMQNIPSLKRFYHKKSIKSEYLKKYKFNIIFNL